MNNLYEMIKQRDDGSNILLITVVDGKLVQNKILLIDGEVAFQSSNTKDLMHLLEDLKSCHATKVIKDGENEIFIEKIGSKNKLVICGAGHVSKSLLALAKRIGFYTIVIDDRPNYCLEEADEYLNFDYAKALDQLESSLDTYFVIATRGHGFDRLCLEKILTKPNAYIGMLGSKNKAKKIKEDLLSNGFDQEKLAQVYAPIGLSIAAEGPEEIAVSIMAQMIMIKNQNKSISFYDEKILEGLLNDPLEKKVLATIIEKSGSTPRKVGTKLIIKKDHSLIGTIGGGIAEANVIKEGIKLLESDSKQYSLLTLDMKSVNQSDEEMICGGQIKVFLEVI